MLRYSLTDVAPVRPSKLRFSLLSAKEIEAMSVCRVTESTLYYRGLPASGGLLDPLMGSVDRRHLCASCMLDAKTCEGHPGHIDLAFPCYHVGFIEPVLKVLRTTCFFCSRVCVAAGEGVGVQPRCKARLTAVHSTVRGRKTCPHCDLPRPTYQRAPLGIVMEWPSDMEWEDEEERAFCTQPFTAREALSILQNIPDDDVRLLGLDPEASHPMNMILQKMAVPPPNARPAIYSSEGSRSRGQNELTVRLLEILKRSHEVAAHLGEVPWEDAPITQELLERVARLQYEIFNLVNNNLRLPKPAGMGRNGGGSQLKSLSDRLKGKEGRVRGNLMGKRVDFSARCVITPDAYFDCDRVGVPERIAMKLTVPETVNRTNIGGLTERVRLGARSVHGADTVISAGGTVTSLASREDRANIRLRPGDVVERFLADDDVVVFNRQPSLHMHGMQAHRVRLMPGHTFRLSLVVAAPYNADFDGDEMNLHVPQSKAASAECALLMGVAQNCVSSQANRPVMGIVQDSLLGLHLMSKNGVVFDHAHSCRILGTVLHGTRALPPADLVVVSSAGVATRHWTGKRLISTILPSGLYVETTPPPAAAADLAAWDDAELPVVVRAGRLLCGVLRKVHVGTSAGGIIDVLCREHEGVACMRFMGDAQRMTHAFLLQRGHHVGIADVILNRDGQDRVRERLAKATALCEEIQREASGAPPEVAERAEGAILRMLSKMLLQTGGIVNEHMSEDNAIRRMVSAGSKGSFINLSQICACLGQQSLEGGRIVAEKGFRTLPYFANHCFSLASRGMVFNSFALGLSPTELFYHGVGGREGLVDTAVKTSQTGYLQRRMNKSMEDHTVHSDGTVRTAGDDVVSFVWGSDGLNPARLERVRLSLLSMGPDAIAARFTPRERACVRALVRAVLEVRTHVLAVAPLDTRVLLPFHPERIKRALDRKRDRSQHADADAVTAARAWTLLAEADASVPRVVLLALHDLFCEQELRGVSLECVERAWAHVMRLVRVAQCVRGESIGCIAAQSIGEPATQMTLNTFHLAGCAAKNVTLGIPRLKELLDCSRAARTPCTTLRFRAPFCGSRAIADFFADTLPLTRLGDVVVQTVIENNAVPPPDDWLLVARQMLDDTASDGASRYTVRLHLHQDIMRARRLTPPLVRRMLAERLGARATVASSEVNAVRWIVSIRFADVSDMMEAGDLAPDQEAILCHRAANVLMDTVLLGGHPAVTSAAAADAVRLDRGGGEEVVVHAFGTFLTDCVSSDCIDWTRCTSNDIWETLAVLGIEACCHVFYDQLRAVVSFDGTYVDDRHMLVITDTVCRNGSLMPLNRHGINRATTSPLMRASFEETIDILCDAAIFAEDENARGVTTSIMTGQLAELGTGTVDVLLPESSLDRRAKELMKVSGRALRSTCRSHREHALPEVMEYLTDDVRPTATRPLSPPSNSDHRRKRARFRPVSPR